MTTTGAIEKTTKNQDGKYKTKESTGLDKSNAELTSDKENVEVELSAVAKNLEKMEDECIAKPETYEDRMARRQAETAGLKEALIALEFGTSPAALFVARSITRCALDLELACTCLVDKTMKLSRTMAWYNDYVSH